MQQAVDLTHPHALPNIVSHASFSNQLQAANMAYEEHQFTSLEAHLHLQLPEPQGSLHSQMPDRNRSDAAQIGYREGSQDLPYVDKEVNEVRHDQNQQHYWEEHNPFPFKP